MSSSLIERQLKDISASDDFLQRLYELTSAWEVAGYGVDVVSSVIKFIEENPGLDYGTPGPLVHFVERFATKDYVDVLLSSVRRKPTFLTVWMVNRAINGSEPPIIQDRLVGAMKYLIENPPEDENLRDAIEAFLEDYR